MFLSFLLHSKVSLQRKKWHAVFIIFLGMYQGQSSLKILTLRDYCIEGQIGKLCSHCSK